MTLDSNLKAILTGDDSKKFIGSSSYEDSANNTPVKPFELNLVETKNTN